MRIKCYKLLLPFLSISISLIISEAVIRRIHVKEYTGLPWSADKSRYQIDGKLIYVFRPNQNSVWTTAEFTEKAHINNLGFRGSEEIQIEKPQNAYRVLMIGDSFTYGHGLSDTQTIPYTLETILQNKAPSGLNIEVINMGVPGYSLDQEFRQMLLYIPRLGPDLVVWNITPWNIAGYIVDTDDSYRPSLYDLTKQKELVELNTVTNKTYLRNMIFLLTPKWIRNTYIFDFMISKFSASSILTGIPKIEQDRLTEWAANKFILEAGAISKMQDKYDFEFIMVLIPSRDYFRSEGQEEYDYILKSIKNNFPTSNIQFVDLRDALSGINHGLSAEVFFSDSGVLGETYQNYDNWFFPIDSHPNATG